ncbi:MAG: hypothetical protein ACP5D7_12740 [Limnospira sp.]
MKPPKANPIDKQKFEFITKKYGYHASWVVWADEEEKPKDNIEDLSVFDLDKNPNLLKIINPNIIFVGLNISRPLEKLLGNFHDSRPQGMDYKIRYALKNSPYYGAYMTDIIKDFEQKGSGKVMSYLSRNKAFEAQNIERFRCEIADLQVAHPQIIAFGNDAYKILNDNLSDEFEILKIPHYSKYISKENYRKEVDAVLHLTEMQMLV